MKKFAKQFFSLVLTLCLCSAVLPIATMSTKAATLSQSQFDAKLSSAKSTYPTGSQKEEWSINGTVVGWQCHGYGRWLSWYVWGVDFANGNGAGWTLLKSSSSSSYINSLVPGDVVRFRRISSSGVLKTWNHTIFITSIIGDTIYYTDCNSDGACTIKWEQSVSKATLDSWLKLPLYGSEAATYGYIAHYTPNTLTGGTVSCNCSSSYAGTYICTTSSLNLTIRSGHGSSYSAIGSIPPGATVTVSKASGTSSSDWAHVTYNGVTGYASMEYLKKQGANHAETPTIRWWLSDTEYGDSVDNCKIGNRYYFCYRLYDSVTGKDWDEVSSNNYTVNIAIYNPDGSLNYDSTKSSDTGWISIFYTTPGTYTRKVVVNGDFLFEGSREFYVDTNPKKVHSSTNSISLNLSGTKSQTIYLWSSGYYSGNAVWNWSSSNSNISCLWGEWTEDNRLPITVTANSIGTTTLTLSLKDKDTGTVLDSVNISVAINVNASTLSVNSTNNAVVSAGGEMQYFTYTPTTSGKYVIYSTGSEDTKVYLYNSNWTELDSDDDDGDGNNFRLEYNLTAGTTYKFAIKYYDSSKNGTISFKFGNVYTITYNANGGSGAPSKQSKDYGTNIALSSTVPTREGYTFLGWSTSYSTTTAMYQPGDTFTDDVSTLLYAVWKQGCENNSHSFSYRVTKTPTVSATGTLLGACSKCYETNAITLPKLNTESYNYSVQTDASCITTGIGRYTLKNTNYGDYYFDVTIPIQDHNEGTEATCTEPQTCTVCGEILKSALGHKAGEWTTLEDGSQEQRCTVCGELLDTKPAPEQPPVDPETKTYALGDINMDGAVNQYDYILAKRAHFNTITFNENQKVLGDMNEDGKNDQYDYILVKRIHFKNYSTDKTVEIVVE